MVQPITSLKQAKTYQPGLSAEELKLKYHLKEVLKLSSNENPLPPPPGLLRALTKALGQVNRYPSYFQPVQELASQYYKVSPQQVTFGNGSSELIDKLMQAYITPGQNAILISKNSFPLYTVFAQSKGILTHKANMCQGFKVDVKALLSLLKKHPPIRLIFISNPNNPTGSYITQQEVQSLLSATENQNVLVVMDEAYQEYARAKDFPHTVPLLKKYPHLVLLRSLSKVMGLAGLRAGVLLAHTPVIKAVTKVLSPFNVNTLALCAMRYCFSQTDFKNYLSNSKNMVWNGLDYFYRELKKAGIEFYPSQGNFLLFRPPNMDKKALGLGEAPAFNFFLKRGLILRPLNEPALTPYLRMSVGTKIENQQAIKQINLLSR